MHGYPKPDKAWHKKVKAFYRKILNEWQIESDGFETFVGTCVSLQRCYQCREQLAKDGITFTTSTGQIKAHPMISSEQKYFAAFMAGMKHLSLEDEVEKRPAHRPTKAAGV